MRVRAVKPFRSTRKLYLLALAWDSKMIYFGDSVSSDVHDLGLLMSHRCIKSTFRSLRQPFRNSNRNISTCPDKNNKKRTRYSSFLESNVSQQQHSILLEFVPPTWNDPSRLESVSCLQVCWSSLNHPSADIQ